MSKSIAWLTDPHLNFVDKKELEDYLKVISDKEPDALMISGDIAEAPSLERCLVALGSVGVPVYFVLGNHDYYRGSIGGVRALVEELTEADNNLYWLPHHGVVKLNDDTCLIGVDGWGDAQLGTPFARCSPIMSDWELIENFRQHRLYGRFERHGIVAQVKELGENEAAQAEVLLKKALENYKNIAFLTHIPPWKEATWHQGNHSDDGWLPWFSCAAVGDTLEHLMWENQDANLTVYCGHTHGRGESDMASNIKAITGGARYHYPAVERVLHFD